MFVIVVILVPGLAQILFNECIEVSNVMYYYYLTLPQ